MTATPDPSTVVLVCTGCHNWQIDVPRRVMRKLGGRTAALWAVADAHNTDHAADCPAAGGRVKILGQWVDRPTMSDGRQADALLGAVPLPLWWVWR